MRKRLLLMVLLPVALGMLLPRGTVMLSPVERTAFPYQYRLVQWEAENFMAKWWFQARRLAGLGPDRQETPREAVDRFFRLGRDAGRILAERERLVAEGSGPASEAVQRVEERLGAVRRERRSLQPEVEEHLEGVLSNVFREEALLLQIGPVALQFPPVDFRFDNPPRLLITSPRDRIEREDTVLLVPDLTIAEMERLEERIYTSQDLSALVEGIGGIATYPATIPHGQPLRTTLQLAAHEWLHHYLFFKPMGRNYWQMVTLNETVASLAGRKLGDMAFERLGGALPSHDPAPDASEDTEGRDDGTQAFDFFREMRETRVRVDELLAQDKIEQAERYMETRRQFFVEHGVYIRKLNQAYFAFHGSYAQSAASSSPVGDQVQDLRDTYATVGRFVLAVSQVSSPAEFERLLEERIGAVAVTGGSHGEADARRP